MSLGLAQLLREIDRLASRLDCTLDGQGPAILDAFLRHSFHRSGALYLRAAGSSGLRLAASSDAFEAPARLEMTVPLDVVDRMLDESVIVRVFADVSIDPSIERLVPLRTSREDLGLIALSGPEPPDDDVHLVDSLRAAARYLSALLGHQRMTDEIREGDFQLKYRLWELQSLYDIGLSIASTLDLDKLADEILFRAISLLNARRAALYLRKDGRFFLHRSFGEVRAQFLDEELDSDSSAKLLLEGSPIRFDASADCIFPGCESFVAMPIQINGEVIGVLAASDREQREGGVGRFEENDLRVLSLFANQVAIALENSRLHHEALEIQAMQRELELAATIQRDILPRSFPQTPQFEVEALFRPAKQLGGDYYAFFVRGDQLSICLADVSGKSVPAAILVSALHAAIQLLFDEGRDLGEIATELNRHIHLWSAENKFITLVLATIDPNENVIRFVNCGHNPAYIVTGGHLETLASHGLPIGLMSGSKYKTQTKPFPAGSLLVVYSDGITEAENVAEDEFGNPMLEDVLLEHSASSVGEVKRSIAEAVDAFVGEASQKDDETIVLVRLKEA